MIYVDEKETSRQLELLALLASDKDLHICAWLYPESKASQLCGIDIEATSNNLEAVTTYQDGTLPRRTNLLPASMTNIKKFLSNERELEENCDSLALYSSDSIEWVAAAIPHERMCLVRENENLSMLLSKGFNAATEAPSWW